MVLSILLARTLIWDYNDIIIYIKSCIRGIIDTSEVRLVEKALSDLKVKSTFGIHDVRPSCSVL